MLEQLAGECWHVCTWMLQNSVQKGFIPQQGLNKVKLYVPCTQTSKQDFVGVKGIPVIFERH